MSSITQGVNFLLVWAYLSSLNVSTGQSNPVHYAQDRATFSRKFTLEGSWGDGKKLTKHRGIAALLKGLDMFFGCKSQACLLGAYNVLPVCDGTG